MLKWLGSRISRSIPDVQVQDMSQTTREVTDDPLAMIDPNRQNQKIYSVSRSVVLPRAALKMGNGTCTGDSGGGTNPLFEEGNSELPPNSRKLHTPTKTPGAKRKLRHSYPSSRDKSNSSGYGGSHGGSSNEPIYNRLREDTQSVSKQNANYSKSMQNPNVPSTGCGSSAAGTLSTIQEGKIDFDIPCPIWPKSESHATTQQILQDSLVDEALLLYTSFHYVPGTEASVEAERNFSVRDILTELSNSISATIDGKNGMSAEETLASIREKIAISLEVLRASTEEEVRKLCVNLSNRKKVNCVLRAFTNSSSSENSREDSPQWNCSRARTFSSETDDFYQLPSGSSSSGFSSDSLKVDDSCCNRLPVHEDLNSVPNGLRNAMIYGTLYRGMKLCGASEKLLDKDGRKELGNKRTPRKSLLQAASDSKPSVWEQYYGIRATSEGEVKYVPKPTDVPLFPGGRPEADFTLDVPRSEMLSKRMKEDKKWRCRCRLLTSFLGLIFFLISVMAVSLMLTRGKRMFGSMV